MVDKKIVSKVKQNILDKIQNAKLDIKIGDIEIEKKINEIMNEIKNADLHKLLSEHKKYYNRLKKRWVYKNKNIEALPELQQTIQEAIETINKLKNLPIVSDIDNINEEKIIKYKNKVIEDLKNWVDDENKLLIEFPLIKQKKEKSIINALTNDIKIILLNELVKMQQKKNEVIPSSIFSVAFDPSNKKKFANEEKNNKQYLTYTHYINDDKVLVSEIDIEEMRKNTLQITANKLCNAIDFEVLRCLFRHIDENFIKDGVIKVPLAVMVKEIFNNDAGSRYDDLIESLAKLSAITNIIKTKRKEMLMFKFLYKAEIIEDPKTKTKIVSVKIDDYIIKDFIKQNLLYIYEDKLNVLSYQSRLMAIYLHKERLERILDKYNENINLIADEFNKLEISYNSFNHVLILGKNKSRNIMYIKTMLSELQSNNILIRNFEYNGLMDFFEIEFYPLTMSVVDKIMNNKRNHSNILPID